ncbi:MAG: DUF348 domain-containing protein [Chloroflexi bacterium]|nr:DUF348 domain-containing protein [Chloroflexota bacterium]
MRTFSGSARGIPRELAPVYAATSFAGVGRGLLPLPEARPGARGLSANVPFLALLSLFAAFSLLWSTTMGLILEAPAPAAALTALVADRAAAASALLHRTAAAFPRAQTVILARLRPGPDEPWWTIIEVDGRALRAAPDATSVGAALAAAGIRLEEGDRILVVPNEGPALSSLVPRGAPPASATSHPLTEIPDSAPTLSPPHAGLAAALDVRAPLSAAATVFNEMVSTQVAAGVPPSLSAAPARVVVQRAVPFSVVDGGVPTGLRLAALTVGEALRVAGIDVDSADLVVPQLESALAPGIRISILRAQPVTIAGPDLHFETRTRAATVGELLAERDVLLGPLDRAEPEASAAVPVGGTVRLVRVRQEESTELQLVPFRTQTQYDDNLVPGTRRRLRAGVAGLVERLVRITLEDEVEVRRVVVAERALRDVIDEVLVAGPAVVPAVSLITQPLAPAATVGVAGVPDPSSVRRVLLMEATAYDPGPASTGKRPGDPAYGITASGMRAGYGVVAVDPRVIPFHTRLYIPGYGYAVAGDTGGAIIGNRIDLGYATYWEAIQWGRKLVPVYILN